MSLLAHSGSRLISSDDSASEDDTYQIERQLTAERNHTTSANRSTLFEDTLGGNNISQNNHDSPESDNDGYITENASIYMDNSSGSDGIRYNDDNISLPRDRATEGSGTGDSYISQDEQDNISVNQDFRNLARSITNGQAGNPPWDGTPGTFEKIKTWVEKQGFEEQSLDEAPNLAARGLAILLWGGIIPCLETEHRAQALIRGCIIDGGRCIKATHTSLGAMASVAPQPRLRPVLGLFNKHPAALDPSQIMPVGEMEHIFNGFGGHYDRVCVEKDHTGYTPDTDTSFFVSQGPLHGRYNNITEIAACLDELDTEPDSVTVTAALNSIDGTDSTLLARRCCLENTENLLFSWIGLNKNQYESEIRPLAHLGDTGTWFMQQADLNSEQGIYEVRSCGGIHGMLRQSNRPEFFDAAEEHGSLWRFTYGLSEHEKAFAAGKDGIASMLQSNHGQDDSGAWYCIIRCSPSFIRDLADAETDLSASEQFKSHSNSGFYQIKSDDYTHFLSGVIDRYYIGMDWVRAKHTLLSPNLIPVYQALFLSLLDFLNVDNFYHNYVMDGRDDNSKRAYGLGFGEAIRTHGFGFLRQIVWDSRPGKSPYLRTDVHLPWRTESGNCGLYTAGTDGTTWREGMLGHLRVVGAMASEHGPNSRWRRLFDILVDQTIYFLLRGWRAYIGQLLLTLYPKRDPSNVSPSLKQKREAYIRQDRIYYDATFVSNTEKELGFPQNSFMFSQRTGLAARSVESLAEFWWEYKVPSTWAQNQFKPKKTPYADDFGVFCSQLAKLQPLHYSVQDFKKSLYKRFWEYHGVFPHPETNHKSLINTATHMKGVRQPRLLMAITYGGDANGLTVITKPLSEVTDYPVLYDDSGITALVESVLPKERKRSNLGRSLDLLPKRRKW